MFNTICSTSDNVDDSSREEARSRAAHIQPIEY